MPPVYLDFQATTPLDPRVLDAMMPYLTSKFGNASSLHSFGVEARTAVETARAQVAALINAREDEIVFTSGATESDNLAIRGVGSGRVVTVKTEHKAILDSCASIAGPVTYLDVAPDGLIDPKSIDLKGARLVSVMAANNEIGVLQDIAAVGARCREAGAWFHTDAAQAAGKIPFDVERMNIDMASLSAHKMYGPTGAGALYVRRRNPRVKLSPIVHGGGHEGGLRSGTLNVAAIVGFGKAAEISKAELKTEGKRLAGLRDMLWSGISRGLDLVHLNGHPTRRLPGNLNVRFQFVEGPRLLEEMSEIAVSSGAACTTARPEPSHVLKALGIPEPDIASSIRYGLGRTTTEADIRIAIDTTVRAVQKLRKDSPLYRKAGG